MPSGPLSIVVYIATFLSFIIFINIIQSTVTVNPRFLSVHTVILDKNIIHHSSVSPSLLNYLAKNLLSVITSFVVVIIIIAITVVVIVNILSITFLFKLALFNQGYSSSLASYCLH